MTCSPASKDITIVSGFIPPSAISPPDMQNAKPLDPVSTKSEEGQGMPLATRCAAAARPAGSAPIIPSGGIPRLAAAYSILPG